jgi:hypothetical protein
MMGNSTMALRSIPLNFVTLYADLAQNVRASTREHGSVVARKRRGKEYLYVVSKDGSERTETYLGPAHDPAVIEEAAVIRQGAEQAKALRSTVSLLKQARIPAPSLYLGRILEVVANAGLFGQGVTLVGTVAFQTYACILGYHLPGAAVMTNDADLLVASFVASGEKKDIKEILQRADPSFKAQMSVNDKLPKVFRSNANFSVDILTSYRRGRISPVLIEELGCSAEALTFMEYLAEESMEAVALYGAGVLVRVPPPVRYAIHKLLIAQERRGKFAAKKKKDLEQARDLLDILLETDEHSLQSELDDARRRGKTWKSAINASLTEIGRDTRQGRLPLIGTKLETGKFSISGQPLIRSRPSRRKVAEQPQPFPRSRKR